jgi:hypothetical protein
MITRFDLGTAPIPYIRQTLALGHKLAAELLRLPLEAGSVHALLPSEAAPEAIADFEEGDVAPTTWLEPGRVLRIDRDEIDAAEAQFIHEYLDRRQGVAIFEHPVASASDHVTSVPSRASYFTHENDLYLLLTGDKTDTSLIYTTMREASGYYSVAALTPGSGLVIPTARQVTDSFLKSIARAADHIIVGAYDGAADLIWSRK